jgi:hypothetical protein
VDDGAYRRVGVVQLKQHFSSRAQQAFLQHLQNSITRESAFKARPPAPQRLRSQKSERIARHG